VSERSISIRLDEVRPHLLIVRSRQQLLIVSDGLGACFVVETLFGTDSRLSFLLDDESFLIEFSFQRSESSVSLLV